MDSAHMNITNRETILNRIAILDQSIDEVKAFLENKENNPYSEELITLKKLQLLSLNTLKKYYQLVNEERLYLSAANNISIKKEQVLNTYYSLEDQIHIKKSKIL